MNTFVRIIRNGHMAPGKLADAELRFTGGELDGLKLIGFAIWARRDGTGQNVTSRRTSSPPMAYAATPFGNQGRYSTDGVDMRTPFGAGRIIRGRGVLTQLLDDVVVRRIALNGQLRAKMCFPVHVDPTTFTRD